MAEFDDNACLSKIKHFVSNNRLFYLLFWIYHIAL